MNTNATVRLQQHEIAKLAKFEVINEKGDRVISPGSRTKIAIKQKAKLARYLSNLPKINLYLIDDVDQEEGYYGEFPITDSSAINVLCPTQSYVGAHAPTAWMILHRLCQAIGLEDHYGDEQRAFREMFMESYGIQNVFDSNIAMFQYSGGMLGLCREMFVFRSARRGTIEDSDEMIYELMTHAIATNWKPVINLPPKITTRIRKRKEYVGYKLVSTKPRERFVKYMRKQITKRFKKWVGKWIEI